MAARSQTESQPPPLLSHDQRQVVVQMAAAISHKLGDRAKRLAHSSANLDLWEAITAVVYLASSACSLVYVTREKGWSHLLAVVGITEVSHHHALSGFLYHSHSCSSCIEMIMEMIYHSQSAGNSQTAEDMVESGFFCMGDADHVKCFFCDLGLRDWERGDSPELEHAKFSPLCFYLKSCLGLDRLKALTPQNANYPSSYSRQDHNQLLKSIGDEFCSPLGRIACGVGLDETKVLLSVARNFIRFRKRWSLSELVSNAQAEWEREILNDPKNPPQFMGDFKLAPVLRDFYRIIIYSPS